MRIACKLTLRLVLIIRLNGPRDDGIPPKYPDEPDTFVLDVPGNIFQLLDKYFPMKSDSDDDEMSGIAMCDLLPYAVRIGPDGTFLVLLLTALHRPLIQQRLRSGQSEFQQYLAYYSYTYTGV